MEKKRTSFMHVNLRQVKLVGLSIISRNLKLGGYRQILGGYKHEPNSNLHFKTFLKNRKNGGGAGGVVSQMGCLYPQYGGCKHITGNLEGLQRALIPVRARAP